MGWLTEQLVFTAKEVLKGRVELQAVTARYVILYCADWIGPGSGPEGLATRLVLAVNYMAKLGWRVAGYSGNACMMEKLEHA